MKLKPLAVVATALVSTVFVSACGAGSAASVDVATSPMLAGAVEGTIARMHRVGFEVRLTVHTLDGEEVLALLTRTHARALGLQEGATVWLTPANGAAVVPSMRVAG